MGKLKSKCFGRRRSRSLGNPATNDLCDFIEKDLSPAERLHKLVELAFQSCLAVAEREFKLPDDFENKSYECLQKINSDIEEKNLCISATSEDECTEDITSTKNFNECTEAIKRYEKESVMWSNLVRKQRECLNGSVEDSLSRFGSSDYELTETHDYTQVLNDASTMHDDLYFQVDYLQYKRKILSVCMKDNDVFQGRLRNKASSYFEDGNLETPKRLIKNIVIRQRKKVSPQKKK